MKIICDGICHFLVDSLIFLKIWSAVLVKLSEKQRLASFCAFERSSGNININSSHNNHSFNFRIYGPFFETKFWENCRILSVLNTNYNVRARLKANSTNTKSHTIHGHTKGLQHLLLCKAAKNVMHFAKWVVIDVLRYIRGTRGHTDHDKHWIVRIRKYIWIFWVSRAVQKSRWWEK